MVKNEVKVIPKSNCKCLTFYQQAGGGPSTERHSGLIMILCNVVQLDENLCRNMFC